MTLPTLLIVTGARRIAERPEAFALARSWLLARVLVLNPAGIVTGDARCIDEAAQSIAAERGIPWQVYDKHGMIQRSEGKAVWWTNDLPPAADAGRHAWAAWLHRRNETMIRRTAMLRDRYDVRLAGLFSSTPGTGGTGMTVDCARAAGIPCETAVF